MFAIQRRFFFFSQLNEHVGLQSVCEMNEHAGLQSVRGINQSFCSLFNVQKKITFKLKRSEDTVDARCVSTLQDRSGQLQLHSKNKKKMFKVA